MSGEARTRLYSLWKRGSGRCSADGHAQGVCGGRLHFLSGGIRGRTDQGGGDEAGEPCNQRHDGERTRAIRNHRERLVANQGNKRKAKSKVGAWCGRLRVGRFDRFMAAGRQGGRAAGRQGIPQGSRGSRGLWRLDLYAAKLRSLHIRRSAFQRETQKLFGGWIFRRDPRSRRS